MSSLLPGVSLEGFAVQVPATDIPAKLAYPIIKGPSQVSWMPNVATSFSSSQITFNCPPPSPGTIVDSTVYLESTFQFTINTGAAVPGITPVRLGLDDAPRCLPISSSVSTMTVSINGTSISSNVADLVGPMTRYHFSRDLRNGTLSTCPSMPDSMQSYNDYKSVGSARNPLASYGENSFETPRGGYSQIAIANNTPGATTATVTMTITECLLLPPFDWGKQSEAGLIGISAMTLQVNLGNLANRLWSRNPLSPSGVATLAPAGSGGTSWWSAAPRLLFKYMSPDPVMPIPRQVVRPIYDISRYTTTGPIIPGGATNSITSSSIQLNAIPHRLYIWLRRRDADQLISTTDTYAFITGISVNFNNRAGLLSSASAQDLYQISRLNGCNLSWTQWALHVGSILAIDFPQDIGLSPIEAPGLMGTYQLQMEVRYQNVSQGNVQYDLYVAPVTDGILITEGGKCSTRIGILGSQDVLDAKLSQSAMSYRQVQQLYGGSFFGSLGRFFSNAYGKIKKVAKDVMPTVRSAIKVAKMIPGLAGPASTIESVVEPVARVLGAGKKKKPKGMAGPMSAAELRRRLA